MPPVPAPALLQVQAASSPADASPMAPRCSDESPRARAILAAAAALLVAPLLLSSLHLTDAVAGSPSPAPAPAPLRHPPPPRHAGPGSSNKPHSTPPVPGRRGGERRAPGAARPTRKSGWWQRLNFGERFGIALAGVAGAMQVALGAFLCARARQLRRARAAAAGKAEEQEAPAAAASSSTPTPA